MIVLDTTVLVYAVGSPHRLRAPRRDVIVAIRQGHVDARTTAEVIQEFAHDRSRRRSGPDAVELARRYATLLSPLVLPTAEDLDDGLGLFQHHPGLGAFDAVLAAIAVARGADAPGLLGGRSRPRCTTGGGSVPRLPAPWSCGLEPRPKRVPAAERKYTRRQGRPRDL